MPIGQVGEPLQTTISSSVITNVAGFGAPRVAFVGLLKVKESVSADSCPASLIIVTVKV